MSETANPYRGEVAIDLADGGVVKLRPSFAALVAAEGELGPLFALVERSASGTLCLSEIIALFWHIRADPQLWPEREPFAEALAGAGLVKLTPALKRITGQILLGQ